MSSQASPRRTPNRQLSQYPGGWGDQRWGGWNQRDSIDIYDTPAPEVPAPAPGD
ncbi:Uncharacterised protein [Mycobacteroides abscessus subsp. abscessus]|nr:Uncharacterised protein [Mycobacteroides abscessus subsp. abscessus]